MQKSTSLTGAYLAEGTSNVKQVSKNKKPKKSKKPKIIAAALNFYLKTTPSRKKSGSHAPLLGRPKTQQKALGQKALGLLFVNGYITLNLILADSV